MEPIQDLRFALRGLRKHPSLPVVASLSLGLGIALNVTVFAIVYSVLFAMPVVDRPDQLVNVYSLADNSSDKNPNSVPDFLDLRQNSEQFDDLTAHSLAILNIRKDGRPSAQIGSLVSANYFDVLGVTPQIGRLFSASEAIGAAGAPAAVLTDRTWRREWGADPKVVGRTVRIGGQTFEVIGVTPRGFTGLMRGLTPGVFVPMAQVDHVEPLGEIVSDGPYERASNLERRGLRFATVTGRLAPGATLASATAELQTLTDNLAAQYPVTNEGRRADLLATRSVRFDPDFDHIVVPAAMVVLVLTALVLVVACANIGNLLLARAENRRREIAVRLSLGSKRSQLVRLLLTESVVLGLCAGLVGFLLATATVQMLGGLELDLPVQPNLELHMGPPVLLFTLGISLLTGVLFGLIPALQSSKPELTPALRDDPGTTSVGRGWRAWLRPARLMVMMQVALCLVLLVGASLLQRSVTAARDVELGYDADRLALLNVDVSPLGLEADERATLWQQIEEAATSIPGVERTAVASRLPLDLNLHGNDFYIAGHRETRDDPALNLDVTRVEPGYFEALGAEVTDGALFTDSTAENPSGIVVTQAMVDRFWPGESAIGRTVRTSTPDGPEYTVVGVIADYKVRTPGEAPRPMVHFQFAADRAPNYGNLLVLTRGDAAALVEPLRKALLELAPDALLLEATTVARRRDTILLPIRAGGFLVSLLSSLALALAMVGLSGLVSFSVARRTKEIGLRVALGAGRQRIAKLVLASTLGMVLSGTVLGLVGAVALGQVLESVLYVPTADPLSLTFGVVALVLCTLLASWIPLRRATRVDPIQALRDS